MQGAAEEAPSRRKQSESEMMESIQKGHNSMCAVLTSRNKNLDLIRAIWTAGDFKASNANNVQTFSYFSFYASTT